MKNLERRVRRLEQISEPEGEAVYLWQEVIELADGRCAVKISMVDKYAGLAGESLHDLQQRLASLMAGDKRALYGSRASLVVFGWQTLPERRSPGK